MKIILASEYEDPDGTTHPAEKPVEFDDATTRMLLREGRARLTPQGQAAAERREDATAAEAASTGSYIDSRDEPTVSVAGTGDVDDNTEKD